MDIAKQCMPSKTVTIRPKDPPWLTNNIKLFMETRKKYHNTAKTTNSADDWKTFRQYRNFVTSEIRKSKSQYLNDLDDKASDPNTFGQKDWWKLVRSFLAKKGMDSDYIPPIPLNNVVYYSDKDKANIFNTFFIEQSSIENNDDALPNVPFLTCEINEIVLTASEVKEVISKLDTSKATGPDLIHNRLLIESLPILLNPLTDLFNRCLDEKKFTAQWKTAHVTPVHKKGQKDSCNNYRPVSLLSCVGKVLERCVHHHIFQFLNENEIITPHQSGFIPGDSTINQLLCIYNDLCVSFDKKITTQSVFFDISKAFDRVWHRGLLVKLESAGIRGKLLEFLSNYLSDRLQCVVIKGQKSDFKNVTAGVPQGSVLGPLLFLVYINDIVNDIESDIKLFADDTSMSLALNDPYKRQDILNSDLNKINDWANSWKVRFNEGKTELLNFARNNHPIHDLTFGSATLHNTQSHKHLGIIFQTNCKWDEQIKSIISKVNLLLSCLKTYKYKLSRKALETMYKSFVLPHFDYADVIWDNCTEEQSNTLEQLHLDGIRTIIGGVRGTSHSKLYEESGFCSLKDRRKHHKLILFYKMINGMCPAYLNNLAPKLVSERNPYHRRRLSERDIPRYRTDLFCNSFFPSTTKLWNDLPENVKNTKSISEFKRYISLQTNPVPLYYYFGNRNEQIIHCQLRLKMSNLKQDLLNRHLTYDPSCCCGSRSETAKHYILHCPLYTNFRATTIHTLPPPQQHLQTLLFGDRTLSNEDNIIIFNAVQSYIKQTCRF